MLPALICLATIVGGVVGIRAIDGLARGGHESAWRAVQRERYDVEVENRRRMIDAAYAAMRESGYEATLNFGPEPTSDPAIRAWRGGTEVQRAVISGPILMLALLAFFVVPWKRLFPMRGRRGRCPRCAYPLALPGATCSECGLSSPRPTGGSTAGQSD